MGMFGSFRDCAGKSVLNCLQVFHLTRVDAVEKGIAVIKLGMNNRCGYCARGFVIKYRNSKLEISTAPTKAKSREPAYSQALVQNKIDRQRVRSRESGRQTIRRLWWMVFGGETGWELGRRG